MSTIQFIYDEQLPVCGLRRQIAQAIEQHQVVIICGETGSGKTTQLPKICLQIGRGAKGKMIAHTQPRRLAAISVAKRVAQELQTPIGELVGYQIRFSRQVGQTTAIKLMTDGVLLAELQQDPLLSRYDTIIIDEAHERSLNIDFLLGFLKPLLRRRRDLKLIVTSATIDAQRFAQHFTLVRQAPRKPIVPPIIEVSGRLYPVDILYRPILPDQDPASDTSTDKEERSTERDLMDAVVDAVMECETYGSGDILVFLPGEREIRETAEALRKHHPVQSVILPLFSRMAQSEQDKIFRPEGNTRRIILATNVAETSLTVPGIRFVIDSGVARVKRYSLRQKVEQLLVEPISQASAKQRAGRAGRLGPGICMRLYSESDFALRPAFTDAEIQRSSLASVVLRMKSLRVKDLDHFPFIEAPSHRALVDGIQQLHELNALDQQQQLTPIGKLLADLPLDPRVARMILAAKEFHCLQEVLIIAAALTLQDPRETPAEKREASTQAHAMFKHEKSEFLSYLKLWEWYHEQVKHKESQRKLIQKLRERFLSPSRLREWHDMYQQLHALVSQRGWRINTTPATYEQIHCSLLAGLLSNFGMQTEEPQQYVGARNIKFLVHPSSTLQKKAGKWLMAAQIVQTSRLYARCVAQIDPRWLEKMGAHLLQYQYSDPQWYMKQGQVLVNERATLYGVTVYHGRKKAYTDQEKAHEIFIREALLTGDIQTKLPFLQHNLKLVADVEKLEHRSRRQDILVDDELIFSFYQHLIPSSVSKTIALEKWYKHLNKAQQEELKLSKADLMRHEAAGVTAHHFPPHLEVDGRPLQLSYHFEPGSPKDGVTLTVPVYALNQIDENQCSWLVSGMLKEKVMTLLKLLPQKIRRHCLPLEHYATQFCERHPQGDTSGKSLPQALVDDIVQHCKIPLTLNDLSVSSLPPHCCMNYRVVDEQGRMLSSSRNLAMLRAQYGIVAQDTLQDLLKDQVKTNITTWDFGDMPDLLELKKGKQTVIGYAALVDQGHSCALDVFDDESTAQRHHRQGLLRLFTFALNDQLKALYKQLGQQRDLSLLSVHLGSFEDIKQEMIDKALSQCALVDPLPHNAATFQTRVAEVKKRIGLLLQELSHLLIQILTHYQTINKHLNQCKYWPWAYEDIQYNLQQLIRRQFITTTPWHYLQYYPRYLQAMLKRIEKLKNNPDRDQRLYNDLQQVQTPYIRQKSQLKGQPNPALDEFFYLLQELRVALFAQELKTPMPISIKRVQKAWNGMGFY